MSLMWTGGLFCEIADRVFFTLTEERCITMANWEQLSVKTVTTKIKDDEVVLPVIQRRLVWTEEKMEALFDSLLKGNSFGAVICIEEEKGTQPLFASRKFTSDGSSVDSLPVDELMQKQWFIVDGQQRLQTFYIGLTGTYNGKRLFFDLYSDFEAGEYDFKFAARAKDLPDINKERPIGDCLWVPVPILYERLKDTNDDEQVAEEYMQKHAVEDPGGIRHINRNMRALYKAVFATESIGVSKVTINKTKPATENRQRVVELFTRLNNGGTTLSAYDLVASMFKGFDSGMEQYLDQVVAEFKDIGINQETLIKMLFILNDQPSREMASIVVKDAEFAVNSSKRVFETLRALRAFLVASSLYNWFSAAKSRSAIPLHCIAYHIFHSSISTENLSMMFDRHDTQHGDFDRMATWCRLSLLNQVFSRGRGWIPYTTGIKKLHTVLAGSKGAAFPDSTLLRVYKEHPLRFHGQVTEINLDEFDQEFLFYLLYECKPTIRSEDIDHIHPRSLLMKAGVDGLLINSVGNFQLLDYGTNRGTKNGKELCDWIEKHVDDEQRQAYLKRHGIPNDCALWRTDSFDKFLEARLKLLTGRVKKAL